MKLLLTELKELLTYDAITGIVRWRKKIHRKIVVGYIAGTNEPNGYLVVGIYGESYKAHRLAWMLYHSKNIPPKMEIDHINGVRNDNRADNLRLATRTTNGSNAALGKNNSSGCRGVTWSNATQKWRVRIADKGTVLELGYFTNLLEAISIRKSKESTLPQYHTNHSRLKPTF